MGPTFFKCFLFTKRHSYRRKNSGPVFFPIHRVVYTRRSSELPLVVVVLMLVAFQLAATHRSVQWPTGGRLTAGLYRRISTATHDERKLLPNTLRIDAGRPRLEDDGTATDIAAAAAAAAAAVSGGSRNSGSEFSLFVPAFVLSLHFPVAKRLR